MNMRVRTTSAGSAPASRSAVDDDLEAAARLRAGIRVARAVGPDRRGRQEHAVAHAHRAADADAGLIGRAGGDVPVRSVIASRILRRLT